MVIGLLLRNPVFVQPLGKPVTGDKAEKLEQFLREHLNFLVRQSKNRNYQNLESLNKAASYIEDSFGNHCDRVERQTYQAEGSEYSNIVCHFDGITDELIVMGAHYDVAGNQDGADDNGSGVATILELARVIKVEGKKPQHNLQIVAYTLEEPPFFRSNLMGSYIHAESLKAKKASLRYMLSVEMVGYYSDEEGSQDYPLPLLSLFYPSTGNFLALIGGLKEFSQIRELKTALIPNLVIPLYSINSPAFVPGIDFSDHLNYWALGYKAYMLTDTAFLRNKNYHETSDTIETLNFRKMCDVVMGLHALAIN
ncbi:MAG: M28 family peptidase [Bdellovibrionales bacterium]|nr:M28 family peptidase [Bdellovibrionales bacterium]